MTAMNALVLIHGMTLDSDASDHTGEYNALWLQLQARQPRLTAGIDAIIPVEWGHKPRPSAEALRPDQRITDAENAIHDRCAYAGVSADHTPDNVLLSPFHELISSLVLRRFTTSIKESVLMLGITDALYYCAPDGEQAIREAVYTQVLDQLEPHRDADHVRLHVVAHSLGTTVAFDFLFGLFAPDEVYGWRGPDFGHERDDDSERLRATRRAYLYWRQRAKAQTLHLMSKFSTGSQIPLLMLRKQKLVDMLAAGELLDPTVIGVPRSGPVRWKVFYDVDDILGFPTRRIFDASGSIREYQVNTDWRPDRAHGAYWQNATVVGEIAELIAQNL